MIRANVDEGLEKKFRELARKRFGYGKGSLSRAVKEAILMWISMVEREEIEFRGDPVEILDGLLSHIEINSVELQHKIKEMWIAGLAQNISS